MDYIQHCQRSDWWIQTWNKANPEQVKEFCYRCRSWRHKGECAEWKAESDYARIKEAMANHAHWSHVVLTYHNWTGRNLKSLWTQSLRNWSMLRKRIRRKWGSFVYVQTWEVTRKGCPHCHMAVSNAGIHEACEPIPQYLDREARTEIGQYNFRQTIGEMAVACGFGPRGFVEAIWGKDGFARYLEKLKRELTQAASKSQLPLDAPRHFRRLRASVGLIPPLHKDDDVTGHLINDQGCIITKRKTVTA
jgi:hypothetical protein